MAIINMGINAREGFNVFLLTLRPLTGTDGLGDTLIEYIRQPASADQLHSANIVRKALVIHIVFAMVNAFVNLFVTSLLGESKADNARFQSLLNFICCCLQQVEFITFIERREHFSEKVSACFTRQSLLPCMQVTATFVRSTLTLLNLPRIESGVLYALALIVYVFAPVQMVLYPALIQIVVRPLVCVSYCSFIIQ